MRRGIAAALLAGVTIAGIAFAANYQSPAPAAPAPVVFPDVGIIYEEPREVEMIEAAIEWHDLEDVTITAYCPNSCCCDEWDDGITYTGTRAQEGVTIAVDPDVIPLGAWVEINGNQYHAEDIGGAIKGNRIDVFFDNHQAALDFGVKKMSVRWYA